MSTGGFPAPNGYLISNILVLGSQFRDPTHTHSTQSKRTAYRCRETCCEICQRDPQTFPMIQFRNVPTSGIDEALYLYSLPERQKLRRMQENHNDNGSLQEAHCRCRTSSKNFGNLITADHRVLSED